MYYAQHNHMNQLSLAETAKKVHDIQSSLEDRIYAPAKIQELDRFGIKLPKDELPAPKVMSIASIEKSIDLIKSVWPAAYSELSAYLSGIIIVENENLRSMTGPTWFGAVFLGTKLLKEPNIVAISTSLVHEIGHMVLFAQTALHSPMNDIRQEIYSPLVGRPRPALMAFHAQIALHRMLLWLFNLQSFLSNRKKQELWPEVSLKLVEKGIRDYTQMYQEGMRNLRTIPFTKDGGLPLMVDFESVSEMLEKINS